MATGITPISPPTALTRKAVSRRAGALIGGWMSVKKLGRGARSDKSPSPKGVSPEVDPSRSVDRCYEFLERRFVSAVFHPCPPLDFAEGVRKMGMGWGILWGMTRSGIVKPSLTTRSVACICTLVHRFGQRHPLPKRRGRPLHHPEALSLTLARLRPRDHASSRRLCPRSRNLVRAGAACAWHAGLSAARWQPLLG